MPTYVNDSGTTKSSWVINANGSAATLDASGLSAARSFVLPDYNGTFSVREDFGTNYNKLNTTGTPTFSTLTLTSQLDCPSIVHSGTIGITPSSGNDLNLVIAGSGAYLHVNTTDAGGVKLERAANTEIGSRLNWYTSGAGKWSFGPLGDGTENFTLFNAVASATTFKVSASANAMTITAELSTNNATVNQTANGDTALKIVRKTDTSPTGNFLDLQDHAGSSLCSITIAGVLTTTNFSGTSSGTNTGDQTNISGNAATVTTNANLTGPITSVGNATSIASQTGTGTKFVVDTSPTIITPTASLSDTGTNSAATVTTIVHNSSGVIAAGFGSVVAFQLQDTTTASVDASNITVTWATAAHASRKARVVHNVYDTSAREAIRIEASGSAAMVGFLGSAASAQLVAPDLGTLATTFGFASGTPTFAQANLSGLGTGVSTALGVNVGSAGAFVTFNGALGTPSSGTVTNLTGTASININGTVGATTPAAGTFTTCAINGNLTIGDASGDNVTVNSVAWTLANAMTWTATAVSSTAEQFITFKVSDDSVASFIIGNASATDGIYAPFVQGTHGGSGPGFNFTARKTTDGGTAGAVLFVAQTAAGGALATSPCHEFRNLSTQQLLIKANNNVDMAGLISKYNGITTVSNGVPSEVATVDLTGQTANIGATTLYAVPAGGGGMYRVTALVVLTTAASVSSTLPNVQITYTDVHTGGAITIDATPVLGVAGTGQTGALTGNTVGLTSGGVIPINAKLSTNIQYSTVNYASSLAGMAYAIHIKLEAQ